MNSLSISTKVPITGRDIWSDPAAYERFVRHTLRESFTKLGVSSLGLLQFHQHDLDFLSSAHVSELMATLIREGICEEVGVSVYEPVEAEQALSVESVGVLQIPVHLLDHRFLDASLRRKYLDANVRLIARSIFFQGLLVEGAALPPVARKEELASVKRRAMGIASQAGVPLEELAVRFLVGNLDGFIDVALMGVDSAQALRENMELVQRAKGKLLSLEILEEFQTLSEEVRELGLLSPAHWGAK